MLKCNLSMVCSVTSYGRQDAECDVIVDETNDPAPSSLTTSQPPSTQPEHEVVLLASSEAEKVKEFVRSFQNNSGVLHLLGEWCMALADDSLTKW